MNQKPTLYLDNPAAPDGYEEVVLPTKRAVCSRCNGDGHHGNPAFDGQPLSYFYDEEPDGQFAEDYFSGLYDVVCEECHGNKVVDVVDWDRLTPDQAEAYAAQLDQEAYDEAVSRAERAMGA